MAGTTTINLRWGMGLATAVPETTVYRAGFIADLRFRTAIRLARRLVFRPPIPQYSTARFEKLLGSILSSLHAPLLST